jgi:AP2 domain-containing protein/HNH endonuclease
VDINLTKDQVAIIDDEDADLSDTRWVAAFNKTCGISGAYYVSNHRLGLIHRVIMGRILGRDLTSDDMVDHRNGNSLDNRRGNLRLANQSLNNANRRKAKHSAQPYKGIRYRAHIQKWEARIWKDKKYYGLGCFETPEEAHEAYCSKAKELYGEFARYD